MATDPTAAAGTRGFNPLHALPSILALKSLRADLQVPRGDALTSVARLLAVDPLTLLRCLRIAHSPLHGADTPSLDVPSTCEFLGVTSVRRAFERRAVDSTGTEPIRALWLRSLATAVAARELAVRRGGDPERAWVLGLLHDLRGWLHFLGHHAEGRPAPWSVEDWVRFWNLPKELLRDGEPSPADGNGDPILRSAEDPTALVQCAEVLADLADFRHPGRSRDSLQMQEILDESASRESLVLSQRIRHSVHDLLAEIGLGGATGPARPQSAVALADPGRPVFGMRGRSTGSQIELVNSLLACNRARSYRAVLTAGTASALRFLDFDRAVVVRWDRSGKRCWIRAKHDLSRVALRQRPLELNDREAADFATALKLEQPVHLVRHDDDDDGLMSMIGADTALATPLNRIFEVPTFLVLDRALTARPVRLHEDVNASVALSGVFTLLVDNLLLRLQRIRAQKSAVSDPLTRLANRTVGMLALEREFAAARRDGCSLSVVMLDLDDFKKLNDAHGHMVGDQALQLTAQVLRRTLRKSDVLCRYGGEEFLAVLPRTEPEDAAVLATRLYLAVEEAGRRYELPVTVSIGVASLHDGDERGDDLLFRADRALYASKASGRNRFSLDAL